MTISQLLRNLTTIISPFAILITVTGVVRSQTPAVSCPNSALTRFVKHTATTGETVAQIAQRYKISPATVIAMNPKLRNGKISNGQEILIPPYDGIVVEVGRGQTWRDIAKKYQVRADVLFELNGCQAPSDIAFIPTAKKSTRTQSHTPVAAAPTPSKFSHYPLVTTTPATIALAYGWQTHPRTREVFFHSGIDLLAMVDTPVQSVADGVVAYAGEQGSYGKLVIINHGNGLQTRYAHLGKIKVTQGQQIQAGSQIGLVGTSGEPTGKEPHLHFEVRENTGLGWAAKEPREYF